MKVIKTHCFTLWLVRALRNFAGTTLLLCRNFTYETRLKSPI